MTWLCSFVTTRRGVPRFWSEVSAEPPPDRFAAHREAEARRELTTGEETARTVLLAAWEVDQSQAERLELLVDQ